MISQLSQRPEAGASNGQHAGALRGCEEMLVVDSRAALRPAQIVEQKLASVLKSVPASHVRMSALLRARVAAGPE